MIDKNHPLYAEYVSKCTAIREEGESKIAEAFKTDPDKALGIDIEIRAKYRDKIKATTREYVEMIARRAENEN